MKDQDKAGIDVEAMSAPVSVEVLNEARQALSMTTVFLIKPVEGDSRSGGKAFYANFAMEMHKQFVTNIGGLPLATAGVSVTDKVNLYINPHFFLSLTTNKRIELLIHEIEHVVNLHLSRSKELDSSGVSKQEVHKMFNIATDANINVSLTDLTENLGVTIERINEQFAKYDSKIRLDKADNSEVHFYKMRQFQEEQGDKLPQGFGEGEGGACDDHSTWGESNANEEIVKAVVKDAANKAAAATGIGNCPHHIIKQLDNLNKSLVDWKRQLAQFAVRTMKFNRENTRNRLNRRTGIQNPGKRKKPQVTIALIGDESGSMSDKSVAQFFCEMDKIASMGIKVMYIPMDAEAGDVIEYKKGMKMERTRCGGTIYQSGIDKAKKLKVDGIVIAGDMDSADRPIDPKIPVLWAIFGNQEPPATFGRKVIITEEI